MTLHHFNRGAAGNTGGYQISRSLRFNSADSAYLNRTPASAGNRKTWTWSNWVKRSTLGTVQIIFSVGTTTNDYTAIFFENDNLKFFRVIGGVYNAQLITSAVFRDPSAWYHIVVSCDAANATATIYVNGVAQSLSTNTQPSNVNGAENSAIAHYISNLSYSSSLYLNGYMTEVNFIDGQALTPSSFGETNAQTGVWQPKAYSGSYGTNGFYLNFSDNSNTTAATLGKDYSGNGNNWTPNNFSVTAGVGNDSLVDSPTSYGTDTGVGGTVRGNYCTLNQLDKGPTYVLTNGNLDATTSHTTDTVVKTTMAVNSGKWYAEIVYTTIAGNYPTVGIVATTFIVGTNAFVGVTSTSYGYGATGVKLNNASTSGYGASWTTGDVIGIAFDLDAGTITFYKNGTSQGVAFTGIPLTNSYCLAFSTVASVNAFTTNFGQRPFAYTAPSGYKALCTQNLPTPTIGATSTTLASKFFAPTIYTQAAGANTITTGLDMSTYGGLIWEKPRSIVESNYLTDTVRGLTKYLVSNTTAAEATTSTYIQSVTSTGYTTAVSTWATGTSMVSWDWIAGGTAVSNTAGSITSTVSANTTSGFSVVTYTGSGSAATVGHGLGVAPSMVIYKSRNAVGSWVVGHASIPTPWTTVCYLDSTSAASNTGTSAFNSTAPTSTVFSIGAGFNPNGQTMVAYCFAEVSGYSKAFSYTGNGSTDGVFVYTGFRPAYVIVKCSSSGGTDWIVEDATRSTTNVVDARLFPNTSDAEISNGNGNIDFLSNGFKLRNAHAGMNASGSTYIGFAFASAPFKYALGR